MKATIIGTAVATAAFFFLFKYGVRANAQDTQGIVDWNDGFGLDDLLLGGGSFLAGHLAGRMIARKL